MGRNYLVDLMNIKNPGDQLVADDEHLSTEVGTKLGQRFVINSIDEDQLIVIDLLDPGTSYMNEKGVPLDSLDILYECRNMEITLKHVEEELRSMVDSEATENIESVSRSLSEGTELLRDDLLRSVIRICEVSSDFQSSYLNRQQTARDIWFNDGVESDNATVRQMICPKCFVLLPVTGQCGCE